MTECSTEITLDVAFHDTDMLKVVWHGNYYKFFGMARTALFQDYGFDANWMEKMGYHMVVAESHCRHSKPLTFGMKFKVRATLIEWEYRLKINYLVTDMEGRRIARGYTTHVSINSATGELCMKTPVEILRLFQSTENRENIANASS